MENKETKELENLIKGEINNLIFDLRNKELTPELLEARINTILALHTLKLIEGGRSE